MSPGARRILLFGCQAVPIFFVLLWVYTWARPTYQETVFRVTNVALGSLSPVMNVRTDTDGTWRVDVREHPPRPTWFFNMGGDLFSQLVFLNLPVLSSLLLATPAPFGVRLRLLAYGLVLLFLLHAISVTACVYALSRLCSSGSSVFCTNLSGILSPGGELSAVALWGLLTWRHWFPREGPFSPPS